MRQAWDSKGFRGGSRLFFWVSKAKIEGFPIFDTSELSHSAVIFGAVGLSAALGGKPWETNLQKQGLEDRFYMFFTCFRIFLHIEHHFHRCSPFSHISSPSFSVGGDSQPCRWKSVSYWQLWAYGISKSIAVISWQHLGQRGMVVFSMAVLYLCLCLLKMYSYDLCLHLIILYVAISISMSISMIIHDYPCPNLCLSIYIFM